MKTSSTRHSIQRTVGVVGMGMVFLVIASIAQAATRQWLAPDFYVDTGFQNQMLHNNAFKKEAVEDPWGGDCREYIPRITCVAEQGPQKEGYKTRTCNQIDNTPYVALIEAVYDRFPVALQRMFCSIHVIMIEPDMESIAYAGVGFSGATLGIRKSIMDAHVDISDILSWKEQIAFGSHAKAYEKAADLPQIDFRPGDLGQDGLMFYVLAHEFGHLLDYSNQINALGGPTCAFPDSPACRALPNSWTALSWKSALDPLTGFDFPFRSDVCFYRCLKAPLSKADVPALYRGLFHSGFVTLYAATNPYDDWAESMTFYLLERHPGAQYIIDTRQGERYDLLNQLHGPLFQEKYSFVDEFMRRSYIEYP